jgi:pimeloyl-ACP methyl ester carboxylesterase
VSAITQTIDELVDHENIQHVVVIGQSGGTVSASVYVNSGLKPAACYVLIAGIFDF